MGHVIVVVIGPPYVARNSMACLYRYCTPWLMLATTFQRPVTDSRTISVCTYSLRRDKYLAYYLADLVLFYATPLLTASVLYALIARTLLRRTRPAVARCSRSRRSTDDDDESAVIDVTTRSGAAAAAASLTASVSAAGDTTSSNVQVALSQCNYIPRLSFLTLTKTGNSGCIINSAEQVMFSSALV